MQVQFFNFFLNGKPFIDMISSPCLLGVFSKSLDAYLTYVRNSPQYQSTYYESTLEYRDDVPDGLEVSIFTG